MKALVIAVLFACCAFGCRTVGPDYHGPPDSAIINAPPANGTFIGADDPAFAPGTPNVTWWRLYESPLLDDLVTEAFSANTDLRMAEANLERSEALLRLARAERQPTATFNLDPGYAQFSPQAFLHDSLVAPRGVYDLGVSVSYELDLFGRLRRLVEAASAEDEAVKAVRDLTRVAVAASTARAYADVCSAGEELAVARRSLALQLRSLEVTQRLVRAGRAASIDFTRSSVQAAQIRADIPTLEGQRSNALYRLAALLGRTPADYPRAVEACTHAPRIAQPIPVGDGASLLRRRPDVREAERSLAAATAAIGVATADLYPRVTLGVTAGSTGITATPLETSTNRYGIGLDIRWEANQSRARARIDAASARSKAVLARFDGVVLTALREVETALSTYRRDLQRVEDLTVAQARAAEAESQARMLYVGGRIDFLSHLDSERSLAVADGALARSHAQVAADQITLFLALGGGWESS